jgi:hypothetical protein
MNVHAVGFEWELGSVSIAQFFTYLETIAGEEFEASRQKRRWHICHAPPYYGGIMITRSDRHGSLELVEGTDGKVKVRVRTSSGNAKPMEFNAFLIHSVTKRGIYLTYRSACSLRVFGYISRHLYNEALGYYRDVALGELDELQDAKGVWKKKQEARSEYKRGQFACRPLYGDAELTELIKKLKRIRAFEWTYARAVVREPAFKPVKNFVSTERGVLRFGLATSAPSKIRAAIIDFIDKYGPKSGKVIGVDDDGDDIPIDLKIKARVLEQYDFDDIITGNPIDLDDLASSPVLKRLSA